MNPFRGMLAEFLTVLLVILCLNMYAHAGVGKKHSDLAAPVYVTNPNAYMFGSISDAAILHEHGKYATNIRFNPARTFMLFSETILFCGDRSQEFAGMVGPIVVTYRKTPHQMYEGIACYELESVDKVLEKTPPDWGMLGSQP